MRAIGSSNFTAAMVEEAARSPAERGLTPFVSAQNEYSWLARDAERELMPACERLGVGFSRTSRSRAACSPASTGAASRRPRARGCTAASSTRRSLDRVEPLEAFARERGLVAARRRDRRARRPAGRGLGDRGRDEAGAGARERRGRQLGAVGRGPRRAARAVTLFPTRQQPQENLRTLRRSLLYRAVSPEKVRPPACKEAVRESNNPPPNVTIVLECLECGVRDDIAKGWRAYLEPDADGVLVFCADCAEREFGSGE